MDHRIPVHADPERIAQVVSNFLGNAVKYSPDDKPVEMRVEVLKTNARVSVRDEDGAGGRNPLAPAA
jgi:signal transduction histidine kinase